MAHLPDRARLFCDSTGLCARSASQAPGVRSATVAMSRAMSIWGTNPAHDLVLLWTSITALSTKTERTECKEGGWVVCLSFVIVGTNVERSG